jgi:hypothetical protein
VVVAEELKGEVEIGGVIVVTARSFHTVVLLTSLLAISGDTNLLTTFVESLDPIHTCTITCTMASVWGFGGLLTYQTPSNGLEHGILQLCTTDTARLQAHLPQNQRATRSPVVLT